MGECLDPRFSSNILRNVRALRSIFEQVIMIPENNTPDIEWEMDSCASSYLLSRITDDEKPIFNGLDETTKCI